MLNLHKYRGYDNLDLTCNYLTIFIWKIERVFTKSEQVALQKIIIKLNNII